MAIAFRAAGSALTVDRQATATPGAPAGLQATDVVLACFRGYGSSGITPPAGWTLVLDQAESPHVNGATTVYWALGNVASYIFTTDSAAAYIAFTVGYSGVNTSTPLDATATGENDGSGTTDTAPSITTATNNAWFVCVFGHNEFVTFVDGAGLTSRQSGRFSPPTLQNIALDVADGIQVTTGPTGAHTTTASVAGISGNITVALREAPPATVPVDTDYLMIFTVQR